MALEENMHWQLKKVWAGVGAGRLEDDRCLRGRSLEVEQSLLEEVVVALP